MTSSVTLLSTEAEYIALSETSKEGIWLRNLLCYMDLRNTTLYPFVDNAPPIKLAKTLKFTSSLKHVNLRYHMIRDTVKKGIVNILFVPTKEQIADIFTKILPRSSFQFFRDKLLKLISKE